MNKVACQVVLNNFDFGIYKILPENYYMDVYTPLLMVLSYIVTRVLFLLIDHLGLGVTTDHCRNIMNS